MLKSSRCAPRIIHSADMAIRLPCAFQPRVLSVTPARSYASAPSSLKARGKTPRLIRSPTPKFFHEFFHDLDEALKDFEKTISVSDPFYEKLNAFRRRIVLASQLSPAAKGSLSGVRNELYDAFRQHRVGGIKKQLLEFKREYEFALEYGNPHQEEQKKAVDLRYPAEWYPLTRSIQRTIHLHVGPTNSGKTYQALKRLKQAQRGFYAGPLRLLAQEIHSRFTAEGIPCALITGDEVRVPETTPRILSNTVEMVNLNENYEVGVIDEIQMISDEARGWAWTRAFMGARVRELHVCGEERSVPLIKKLSDLAGDTLKVHRYQRLNPLKVESTSLENNLGNLRKGDCVVAFSRVNIHALKRQIEKATGKRAAIVYGGLPAEIRTQQANLFNDPDNDYDFLVASDAIGMGLNLKCRRIIFQTLIKNVKGQLTRISIPEIKQIGGRAGRYRAANEKGNPDDSKEPNVGLVTCLEDVDLPYIQQAMKFEPGPLTKAGVQPMEKAFQRIAPYFPSDASYKFIIDRVYSLVALHPLFFVCTRRSHIEIAKLIDSSNFRLRLEDAMVFMAAPINDRNPILAKVSQAYMRTAATNNSGHLLDIPEVNLEALELPVSGSKEYLHELESLHQALILYLWLSYRLGGIFTDRTLAQHVKSMVEERMIRALSEFSANRTLRKDASLQRDLELKRQQEEKARLLSATDANELGGDLTNDILGPPLGEDDTSSQNEGQLSATA